MLDFSQRSSNKELLDANDIPFDDIKQNMTELNIINSLLGGHKITLSGISLFSKHQKTIHIVEMGCGGGDSLYAIATFLKKRNINYKLTGIDIKQECVDYARSKYPSIQFICSDYKEVLFESKPDVIFNSLFCHHFSNIELVQVLRWMHENASQGFFINDLQRSKLAYYAIKLLTSLFSKSYLVKNDAPLSVARSFTKNDWQKILQQTGIVQYQIKWKWAFRYLVSCKY